MARDALTEPRGIPADIRPAQPPGGRQPGVPPGRSGGRTVEH
ncbi:hypothetical protein [Streptomyces yunnanensis]|nr:hypothetical protein [Streptomyces yunnanensis]